MPYKSKAQARAMHAAASGKSSLGIPRSVGKEYVREGHGKSQKNLPERKSAFGRKKKKGNPHY